MSDQPKSSGARDHHRTRRRHPLFRARRPRIPKFAHVPAHLERGPDEDEHRRTRPSVAYDDCIRGEGSSSRGARSTTWALLGWVDGPRVQGRGVRRRRVWSTNAARCDLTDVKKAGAEGFDSEAQNGSNGRWIGARATTLSIGCGRSARVSSSRTDRPNSTAKTRVKHSCDHKGADCRARGRGGPRLLWTDDSIGVDSGRNCSKARGYARRPLIGRDSARCAATNSRSWRAQSAAMRSR